MMRLHPNSVDEFVLPTPRNCTVVIQVVNKACIKNSGYEMSADPCYI